MANYAVIRDGVVENIVVIDDPNAWTPPDGTTIVHVEDGTFFDIGYLYVDGQFVPPEGPTEDTV
ncbi:hypothetical protein [Cupriavidus gilardii]|uniref:hypothetical protein n=1 Tax=Cupriavidus gilardii TaxID=82541 RepID=UPI001572D1CA|nr:hypothetical protein [Cupriavidus gilardii]NSX05103.1 hypothetical protein [Cupriavidus gilardii]